MYKSYLKFLSQLIKLIRGEGCAWPFIIRQAGITAAAGTADSTDTTAITAATTRVRLSLLLHLSHPVNIKS